MTLSNFNQDTEYFNPRAPLPPRSEAMDADVTDYLVAAAAEQLGARACTTNLRHFPMFPDLEAPYE